MSTILETYDWSLVSRANKRKRLRSYPWDEWFDGRIHQLEPKVDFDGPPTSLERVIRTSANRRGIKVRIRIDGRNVVVQRHQDGDLLRTITRSPSLRTLQRRARAAQAPHSNGDGKVPTKTAQAAQKATTPRRRMKRVPATV